MAWQYAQAGKLAPALAVFLSLALAGCQAPDDDRARLFNEDGVHLFTQGDYAAALDSFDLAVTLRPQDANLLFNIGECYDRLGDAKLAEKYYGSCLMRAPKHGDARMALVELQYRTAQKAQADALIEQWLAQDPKSSDAFVLDAWRLRQAKAYPEAQGRLQQALDADPRNRRALAELAALYETTGNPQRAFVLYERILDRDPGQAPIAQRLDVLRLQGVSRPRPD
jgi:Tfp pilus assembly protein PilF